MLGKQDRWQGELFVLGSLKDLVPEDHILRRVDRVLDLGWLRREVQGLYDLEQGRPGIDPEAAVRLMLAGFFQGIVQDRKLMREAQVNVAMRWFAGYKLHEALPHHSSLTRIRQRWGEERFKRIFDRTVAQCLEHGLVSAETVHIDATLIRANVSWESLIERHASEVITQNGAEPPEPTPGEPARTKARRGKEKVKKISRSDPEASLTTSSREQPMAPCYKQHTAVDDQCGVVVDVAVTTGEQSEGEQLIEQLERVVSRLGQSPRTVTSDTGYAHTRNYQQLEQRGIEALIPPAPEPARKGAIPLRRFRYDAKHQVVWCPRRKRLSRTRRGTRGWWYEARRQDCGRCPWRRRCFSAKGTRRKVLIVDGYDALLRARRQRSQWDAEDQRLYRRHRGLVEGVHGESKNEHGLRRAVRRGRANVAIQAYLTATVLNLKRLARLGRHGIRACGPFAQGSAPVRAVWASAWALENQPAPLLAMAA